MTRYLGGKEILNTKNNEFNSAAIFTLWHESPRLRRAAIAIGGGGVGVTFVYYFSRQFMTFPGLLIFLPPYNSHWGRGNKNCYRFSWQFMKFPGLLKL